MNKQGKIIYSTPLLVKLLGALIGALGLFLTAFERTVVGAALIGLGGVLLALGEKLGG